MSNHLLTSPLKLENSIKTKKFFTQAINTCEYIVLHHTGAGKDQDLINYLALNPAQVSCHYIVTTQWTIYQIAEDRQCTWHAGISQWEDKKNLNFFSIGIEIVSDGLTFSDEQRSAVKKLVHHLMNKHNITHKKILRHKDIAPGRKRDIGDNFWNERYSSWSAYQDSFHTSAQDFAQKAERARMNAIRNGMRPKDTATREEVAVMITNAINYLKQSKL